MADDTDTGPSEASTNPPLSDAPPPAAPSEAERMAVVLTQLEAAGRILSATAEVSRRAVGERLHELDPLMKKVEGLEGMLAPIIFFLVVNTIAVIVIAIKVFKH